MTRNRIVLVAACALLLAVPLPGSAARAQGDMLRLSVTETGAEAHGLSSWPAVSQDGRTVAFLSYAALVASDTNNARDVYVRDLVTGAIERVSVRTDGSQSTADSNTQTSRPSLSADGRIVAFESGAPDLVDGDTNAVDDVFVHNRDTGVTIRASVTADGKQVAAHSSEPVLSGNGKYLFFISEDDGLVPDDISPYQDVFRRDLTTGALDLVSLDSEGRQTVFDMHGLTSNYDGTVIAWSSPAPGYEVPDLNGISNDIFVRDLTTGKTERISNSPAGPQGNRASLVPMLSADGRYVTYSSIATNLVPMDSNNFVDIFVYDRVTRRTERVSVDSDGLQVPRGGGVPTISADGRFIAFNGVSTELDPVEEGNGGTDAYVHDRVTHETFVVSTTPAGTTGSDLSHSPFIGGTGEVVAFNSEATDLVPGDTNEERDIFARVLGPAFGIGGLTADASGAVAGWARFAAAGVSATDPANDASFQVRTGGGEIVSASATLRRERGDIHLRTDVAGLPHVPAYHVGTPGVGYFWNFKIGTVAYQIRYAYAAGENAAPQLQRCAPACTTVATLRGALGHAGETLTISLPLSDLGVPADSVVKNLSASTSFNGVAVNTSGDSVTLPNLTLGAARVEIGVADAGTPVEAVTFGEVAQTDGRFAVHLGPLSGKDVWARACIGTECSTARSVAVA